MCAVVAVAPLGRPTRPRDGPQGRKGRRGHGQMTDRKEPWYCEVHRQLTDILIHKNFVFTRIKLHFK